MLVRNNFARASTFNFVGLVVPLLIALITVPVAARGLGATGFSLILLAWTITGYFGAFDLGYGRAMAKLGAEDLSAGRLHRLMRTALLHQLLLGGALALVFALVAPALATLVRTPPQFQPEAVRGFRFLAMAIPAVMVSSTCRGALEALGRFDLVNALRLPVNSAPYAVTLAGVALEQSPATIIGWIVLARVAGAVVHWLVAVRKLGSRGGSFDDPDWKALVSFGGWTSVTNTLAPLINYLDRFMVGALVSLSAVSFYAAPYELTSKLMLLPGSVAPVLLPAVAAALADGQVGQASRLIRKAYLWSAGLLLFPCALLVILAPIVLQAWLGGSYAAESTVTLRLLAVAGFFNGMALIPFTTLEALGRPDLVAKYHLIEFPAYVVLAVLLIRSMGIEGAALVWVLRTAVGWVALTLLASAAARHRQMKLRWGLVAGL